MSSEIAIVKYPHPALRHLSKPLKRVDAELREIAARMFQLMYETKGIGLAGNQVALPYRLIVINPTGDPERKDQEFCLLNPVLSRPKGVEEMDEGCLSFPEIWAPVKRAKTIRLNAYTIQGEEVNWEADGMLARVLQHECDHLDGVVFVDRTTETEKLRIRDDLEELSIEYRQNESLGRIPSAERIAAQLAELETLRCV